MGMTFSVDLRAVSGLCKGKDYWWRRWEMVRKIAYLTGLFFFSALFLDPTWGQLVNRIELINPLPVPVQGDVAVRGDVNVVNTPEVIIRSMPDVSISGDVSVVNSPEVKIAGVARVEVVNDTERSIPVRVTNAPSAVAEEKTKSFFSWHDRASVNDKTKERKHRAIPPSQMANRGFVLTDLVATARFKKDAAELIVRIHGTAAERTQGMDVILTPWSPLMVSHFQTGIVFQPDMAIDVSLAGDGGGGKFQIDYALTFSGYFLPGS
jgi:hypothetical protein